VAVEGSGDDKPDITVGGAVRSVAAATVDVVDIAVCTLSTPMGSAGSVVGTPASVTDTTEDAASVAARMAVRRALMAVNTKVLNPKWFSECVSRMSNRLAMQACPTSPAKPTHSEFVIACRTCGGSNIDCLHAAYAYACEAGASLTSVLY
jgi:hypothetical protein